MSSPELNPNPQVNEEQQKPPIKEPQKVFESVFAFPPNRETLGGTAYLIVENPGNILVDSPPWNPLNQNFLAEQGGVAWLVLTHRGGMARVAQIQQQLGCQILVQEQEAYLLPELAVTSWGNRFDLSPRTHTLWTPGHSPGSACLYHQIDAGGILFTGRHLLPNHQGHPLPLRTAKTFHWPRQLQSLQMLRQQFGPETLHFICPGANTGLLRGQRAIADAYAHLAQLDLPALRENPARLDNSYS